MKTKSDAVTAKQLQKMRRLRYPRLIDQDGNKWLVDGHGIVFVERTVKAVCPPSADHIFIALNWISKNQKAFRRIRSASTLKVQIEHTSEYITTGAACAALAAIGCRLSPLQAGDIRIIHARKSQKT